MSQAGEVPSLGLDQLHSLYPFASNDPAALLELSFGKTLALLPMMESLPGARLVVFTPDEAREKWARQLASAQKERVRFLRADPAKPAWIASLPAGFHFICVSWGSEELPSGAALSSLQQLGKKLATGGVLAMLVELDSPGPMLREHYRHLLEKECGTQLPAPAEKNLALPTDGQVRFWLESAGLEPVDIFWKFGPYAVIFGMKSA